MHRELVQQRTRINPFARMLNFITHGFSYNFCGFAQVRTSLRLLS